MSETMLGSLGFELPADRHVMLAELANKLVGRRVSFTLKENEYTVVVRFTAKLTAVKSRENFVEAGHLTVHEFTYQFVNDLGVEVFIPLPEIMEVQGRDAKSPALYITMRKYFWSMEAAE